MLISASMWSCHAAGGFTVSATLIASEYAIILANLSSLELYFRAIIFDGTVA